MAATNDLNPTTADLLSFFEGPSGESTRDESIWVPNDDFARHELVPEGIRLKIQPEVLGRLWFDISSELPENYRAALTDLALLVNPRTRVVFGWAGGTVYSLRLPEPEFTEAMSSGGKVKWTFNDAWINGLGPECNTIYDLSELGRGWIFAQWRNLEIERRWCLAAFNYAAET